MEELQTTLIQIVSDREALSGKREKISQLASQQAGRMLPEACSQFSQLLRIDDMNPLQRYPQLQERLTDSTPRSAKGKGRVEASRDTGHNVSVTNSYNPEHAESTTDAIEFVVFDYLPRGGEFAVVPVMLFENGEACTDMALITEYQDAEQHKRQHPARWRQWRFQGDRVQLKGEGDWQDVQYQQQYTGFPEGYRFDHRYKRLNSMSSGGGNFAMASRHIELNKDGTFISGQATFANSENSTTGAQASVASLPDNRTGRYRVEGYLLTLEYDSGEVVHKSIVTDDQDDPEVIWINGYDYVSY
ncbi:hypothetical protein GCM10007392_48270 [Saccharospirillum salsuginis]|uniref:Uncharacterized protein n=1 Tax=Saccharospirillum salsuginis TaxID=418750 RepID=A0A918KTU4_9GAMM|nr:hypothetical protein GCM10007392_48270 [Saccharospirillum salsuginis]